MRPWSVQDHSSSADFRHLRDVRCAVCMDFGLYGLPKRLSAAQCCVYAQFSQTCRQLVPFCSSKCHDSVMSGYGENVLVVNVPTRSSLGLPRRVGETGTDFALTADHFYAPRLHLHPPPTTKSIASLCSDSCWRTNHHQFLICAC